MIINFVDILMNTLHYVPLQDTSRVCCYSIKARAVK